MTCGAECPCGTRPVLYTGEKFCSALVQCKYNLDMRYRLKLMIDEYLVLRYMVLIIASCITLG